MLIVNMCILLVLVCGFVVTFSALMNLQAMIGQMREEVKRK